MKFSIITPHFEQLNWLSLCVASVADQVCDNNLCIEHIIQDAGTPGIEDFARSHGAAYYTGDLSAPDIGSPRALSAYTLSILARKTPVCMMPSTAVSAVPVETLWRG